MTAPITFPQLDPATLTELCQRYEDTPNVESRTRYQMILLAQQDYKVPQIARMVLRSEDTVARVLNRFEAGRIGRGTPAQPARPGAKGHGSVGSREARASLRWIPHASRTGHGQLDHRVASLST